MALGTAIFLSYVILHAAFYSYLTLSSGTSLVGKATKGQLKANGSLKLAQNTVWYSSSDVEIRKLPLINLNSTHCHYINGYECYKITKIAYWLNGSYERPSRSECDRHTCKVTITFELSSDKGLVFEVNEQELTPLPKTCPSTRAQVKLEFTHPAHSVATFWYTQILIQLSFAEKAPQRSHQPPKNLIAAHPLLDHTCQPQFIYGFDTKDKKKPRHFPWSLYP